MLSGIGFVCDDTGWYLMVLGQYWAYWFVYGGTGSVLGSNGWYMVVLGQYKAVLVGTGGTGSVWKLLFGIWWY